jgi:hypothetical protein
VPPNRRVIGTNWNQHQFTRGTSPVRLSTTRRCDSGTNC